VPSARSSDGASPDGIAPGAIGTLVGRRVTRDIRAGTLIDAGEIEALGPGSGGRP
jgi:hypothetical protein